MGVAPSPTFRTTGGNGSPQRPEVVAGPVATHLLGPVSGCRDLACSPHGAGVVVGEQPGVKRHQSRQIPEDVWRPEYLRAVRRMSREGKGSCVQTGGLDGREPARPPATLSRAAPPTVGVTPSAPWPSPSHASGRRPPGSPEPARPSPDPTSSSRFLAAANRARAFTLPERAAFRVEEERRARVVAELQQAGSGSRCRPRPCPRGSRCRKIGIEVRFDGPKDALARLYALAQVLGNDSRRTPRRGGPRAGSGPLRT